MKNNNDDDVKFKKRKGRYLCDVDGCWGYAYAEMYRIGKGNWMYVCRKHMQRKLKNGKPIEKNIGFYVMDRIKRRNVLWKIKQQAKTKTTKKAKSKIRKTRKS